MTKISSLRLIAFGAVVGIAFCFGACRAQSASFEKDFLIDPAKPYVYLEADHVGPRPPLRSEEPSVGLWMRLINNCKVPIVVATFGSSTSRPAAVNLIDEVVPNPPSPTGDTAGSGILYKKNQEGLRDIFLNPNRTESEVRGAEEAAKEAGQLERTSRPRGYNSGLQPGVERIEVIPPGGKVSFSVPISHLSKTWHFEIPFRLALERRSSIRPPYSYVALFLEDLSEGDRALILQSKAFKSTSSGSTPVSEAKRSRSPR